MYIYRYSRMYNTVYITVYIYIYHEGRSVRLWDLDVVGIY